MGNEASVGVPAFPVALKDFLQHSQSTPHTASHLRKSNTNFENFVFIWSFSSSSAYTENEAINFQEFQQFEQDKAYVVLHAFLRKESLPSRSVTRANKNALSLCKLVESAQKFLSPSGLNEPFGHISLDMFSKSSTEGFAHELYIWNGVNAPPLVKAAALTSCFRIERELIKPESINFLLQRESVPFFSLYNFDLNKSQETFFQTYRLFRHLSHQPKEVSSNVFQHFQKPFTQYKVVDQFLNLLPDKEMEVIQVEESFNSDSMISSSPGRLIKHYDSICSKIIEFIFLGSRLPAQDLNQLKENNITHILNCAGMVCKNQFPNDLTYKTLFLYDAAHQDVTYVFYDVIEFFETTKREGGKVYVHCHQGVSRSTTMVICHLIWSRGWTFQESHEFVKNIRMTASPNAGFIAQLINWKKRIDTGREMRQFFRISPQSPYDIDYLVAKIVHKIQSSSLDPRSCFLLHLPHKNYLWIGMDCPLEYISAAKKRLEQFSRFEKWQTDLEQVKQNEEPESFWNELGGRQQIGYVTEYDIDYSPPKSPPKYYFDEAKGKDPTKIETPSSKVVPSLFVYEEGAFTEFGMFDSDDLDEERVYVLDPMDGEGIHVWVGESVSGTNCEEIGRKFLKEKKKENIPVFVQRQSEEAEEFWDLFPNG